MNPANVKKPKKKPSQSPVNAALEYEPKEKRRRSPRNSGEQIATEPPVIKVKKRRPKVTKSADSEGIEAQASKGGTILQDPEKKKHVDPVERTFDATKIALPFADTPIIRRNKEMRKGVENGHRRSSLGNRGRRASSLIDSGKSNGNQLFPLTVKPANLALALPHDEVESTEFYKHIESGLPEPRRMRQLLIWCGTRALAEKPSSTSEDYQARFSGTKQDPLSSLSILIFFSTRNPATVAEGFFRKVRVIRLV